MRAMAEEVRPRFILASAAGAHYAPALLLPSLIAILLAEYRPAVAAEASAKKKRGRTPAEEYPHATLASERLRVRVYLPDADAGFYRACRFDWTSMVGPVALDGKSVFLENWRVPHDPSIPEHGIGFAEEYGMPGVDSPPGYTTSDGSKFFKIGVGVCENDLGGMPYNFSHPYPVARPAKTAHRQASGNSIEFRSSDAFEEWGYELKKLIAVTDNRIEIKHSLTNTGQSPLQTWKYSHNLFNVKGSEIGSSFRFHLPFDLHGDSMGTCVGNAAKFIAPNHGSYPSRSFTVKENLKKDTVLYCDFASDLAANCDAVTHNAFVVRDSEKGGFVKTGSDRIEAFHFYAEETVLALEPYSSINLSPGQTHSWTHNITFFGKTSEGAVAQNTLGRDYDKRMMHVLTTKRTSSILAVGILMVLVVFSLTLLLFRKYVSILLGTHINVRSNAKSHDGKLSGLLIVVKKCFDSR